MQILKRALCLSLFLMLTVFSASATYRLVIQSGHEGPPVAFEWHALTGTIVSAGEDGRLIVTDPQNQRILHRFRVAESQIHGIKVDPSSDRAAVITSDSSGFRVSVWDWGDEKKIYSQSMDTKPLFTSWSAGGRYLAIGNLGNPNLFLLEGRTGRQLPYLQRLPSFYNAGYIGSTEKILMTYAASGAIRYWDIRSSALKLSVETIGNLQGVTVLQIESKSTLFGYHNETLYLINRQTGEVLDKIDISGLVDVSVDPNNGELDALLMKRGGAFISCYEILDGQFVPRYKESSEDSDTTTLLALDSGIRPIGILRSHGNTFITTESGQIYSGNNTLLPLVEDHMWRPNSLAFSNESAFLSGEKKILRFNSPFFADNASSRTSNLSELTQDSTDIESQASETRIEALEDGGLLIWDYLNFSLGNGFRTMRFNQASTVFFVEMSGPIHDMDIIDDNRLLAVDRSGRITIMDYRTGEELLEYSALGILDAAYSVSQDYLLAGRSSSDRISSPLEKIDVETGESIFITDRRFMIYRLAAVPKGIYSIGIRYDEVKGMKTSLMFHTDNDPSQTTTVLEVNGEEMDGIVLPHPSKNGVYTNLGGTVRYITGNRRTSFPWKEPIVSLDIRGNVLYGLDRDGTLVLWNATNGQRILDLYFFDDEGWVALSADGDTLWTSSGAIENVIIYRNGQPVNPHRVRNRNFP